MGTYDTVSKKPLLLYAKVMKDTLWGFIDVKGNEVIKPQFAFVEDFKDGFARAGRYVEGAYFSKNNKYWLINLKGEAVSAAYEYIGQPEKGFRVVWENENYGVLQAGGKEILPPEYKGVTIDEKYFFVFDKHTAVFNHKGRQLTDFVNHRLERQGAFLIEIDRNFRLLHPDKFYPLNNEWYPEGEYKISGDQDWPEDKKVMAVKGKQGFYLVDHKGRHLSGDYVYLEKRSAHYYEGMDDTGTWLINDKGKRVLKITYRDSTTFSKDEDFFEVRNEVNTPPTLYDRHFRKVDFSTYDRADIADENLIVVKKDGKCGLTNYKGRVVLPLQENWFYNYNGWNISGQLRASPDGCKQGITDAKGNAVIPCIYDDVYPQYGIYYVSQQGYTGLFDTKGRQLLDIAYQQIEPMSKPGYYRVMQNDKWGIVNNIFEITARPQFNEIVAEYPDENLVLVSFDEGMSLFDYRGWEVMPFNYELRDSIRMMGGIAFLNKEPVMGLNFKGMFVVDTNEGLQWVDLYGNRFEFIESIGTN